MTKTTKTPAAKAEFNPHRTDAAQQARTQELIAADGAEAKLRANRADRVDWSQAPTDADTYVVRDDNHGRTAATWMSSGGAGLFADAPQFFAVEPGECVRLSRPADAHRAMGNAPMTSDPGAIEARPRLQDRLDARNDWPKREGENPHSHNVSGYRKMSDYEVNAINDLKDEERGIASIMRNLEFLKPDPRCMAIARTKFEEAFMFAVKAIAKPADPYRS